MFAISIFALCVSASVCFTDELHFRCTEDQSIRQGPHYPRACNFPHSVSGRGSGGGRVMGALVPFVLVLGFLLFHLHVLACALLLALVLVFFSLCVFVYLCGAFVQLEVPARLVTNPAPDRQNRQL